MPRQTITLTDPNAAWLQARVDSGEFRTQTEAVNDALRRVRESERMMETEEEIAALRARLDEADARGMSDRTPEDIRQKALQHLRAHGKI